MVYDYEVSDTPEIQKFFDKALKSSLQYYSELIDVNHVHTITQPNLKCAGHNIKSSIDMGDADILLFISTYTSTLVPSSSYVCLLDKNIKDFPYVISIWFHQKILESNYKKYKLNGQMGGFYFELVNLINKEMFELIGLSEFNIKHYKGYSSQDDILELLSTEPRGYKAMVMKTPNVKKEVQDFFGCPDFPGLPLENKGSFYYNYLEMMLFPNNLITGIQAFMPRGLSRVELAILDDTNWYNSINYDLAEVYYWGKDKGCDFLNDPCFQLSNKFQEFQVNKYSVYGCSFDYKSKAKQCLEKYFTTMNYIFDFCNYLEPYQACDNGIHNQDSNAELFESFQSNSRCFESSVRNKNQIIDPISQRCYDSSCNEDGTIVYIHLNSNIKLECYMNNQIINVDNINGVEGEVLCPNDIKRFCADMNTCENLCSKNGYCVQNKCRCLKGYGGKTCQLKCQSGQFVYEDNGNSVCINSGCPQGYYLDTNQNLYNNVYTCLECFKGCSECTNSKSDQCTACFSGYTLDSGKCKKNCVSNSNCLECDGKNNCIQCQSGYLLQNNECKQDCDDGFYEKNGVCLQCPLELNCQTCKYDNVKSQVVCLSCIQGQVSSLDVFFILKDNVCINKCPDGYYKNINGQCVLCDSNCATCDGPYNHNCLSCRSDKKFHQNMCLNNCPEGFNLVAGECKRITCYDNEYERVRNGECVYEQCYKNQYVYMNGINTYCNNCSYNCKTCVDFPDKCTSCKNSDEELIDNKCYSKQKLKDRQVQDTQQLSETKQSQQLSKILSNNQYFLIIAITLYLII